MIRSGKDDFKDLSGETASLEAASEVCGEPILPSLESALNTRLGLALPQTMRSIAQRFVNREPLQHIAGAEALSISTVKDYLRYVERTLRCKPLALESAMTEPITNAPEPRPINNEELGFERFLAKAKCQACGKNIEGDSERVLMIPMALNYQMDKDDWGNHRISPHVPHGAANHYCLACIHSIEQFSMPNPWFISAEESQETTRWIEECKAREQAESAENDGRLRNALARGDMPAFDAAVPTSPSRGDVLARAVPVSRLAAKIAKGIDGEASTADISDQIFANDEGWKKLAATQSAVSGVDAQRAKVLEYLNSPLSRGKMLDVEREAARLWAEGRSQNEIASRQRVNQSTVHRRIEAAKRKAFARR